MSNDLLFALQLHAMYIRVIRIDFMKVKYLII